VINVPEEVPVRQDLESDSLDISLDLAGLPNMVTLEQEERERAGKQNTFYLDK